MLKIRVNGKTEEYPEGTTYKEIADKHQAEEDYTILLVKAGLHIRELFMKAEEGDDITFITGADRIGNMVYNRSALFLMVKAFHDVTPVGTARRVYAAFECSNGLYCRLRGREVTPEMLQKVEERMRELVDLDLPIEKTNMKTAEAVKMFRKQGQRDKAGLFEFRRTSEINVYTLDGYKDYFYSNMVASTGYLKLFRIFPYKEGFILQVPEMNAPDVLGEYRPLEIMFDTMSRSRTWCDKLNLDSVSELNQWITEGKGNDLVLIQEAIMEKQFGNIASEIAESGKKLILLAGPSSSGKTTSSYRLSIQLRALGLHPHPIACDNYYKNREDYPVDENGNVDYEDIRCLNIEQLNKDLTALLQGEKVELPVFDFVNGKSGYKGDFLQLGPDDVIVLEGIHCLNDELTYAISKDSKYRIFISALTQINIDEHSRIPITDGRLIRRMVRDARIRGTSAKETIARWESVRNGEDKYITPYQDNADVMVNSALIYELAVLKPYAEPLLFGISKNDPEYMEAKRLLKFFDYMLTIPADIIPKNSLVREFIGGGCFKV